MAANIVVVHDDSDFLDRATTALRLPGVKVLFVATRAPSTFERVSDDDPARVAIGWLAD